MFSVNANCLLLLFVFVVLFVSLLLLGGFFGVFCIFVGEREKCFI